MQLVLCNLVPESVQTGLDGDLGLISTEEIPELIFAGLELSWSSQQFTLLSKIETTRFLLFKDHKTSFTPLIALTNMKQSNF